MSLITTIEGNYNAGKHHTRFPEVEHFSQGSFRFSFGKLEKQIPDFDALIKEAGVREGVIRTLEIGTNDGNSISSVYQYLLEHVPEGIPIEMFFIDIGEAAILEGLQEQLNDIVRRDDEGNPIDSFVYYQQTDTNDFLTSTMPDVGKFFLIYGYGVEFLLRFPDTRESKEFIAALKSSYPKILAPEGIIMFWNAVPANMNNQIAMFGENGLDYSWGPTYIEQYIPHTEEP